MKKKVDLTSPLLCVTLVVLSVLVCCGYVHAEPEYCARPRTWTQEPTICLPGDGYTCPIDTDKNLKAFMKELVLGALYRVNNVRDAKMFLKDYGYGWQDVVRSKR